MGNEEWRAVSGYGGLYEVSNTGFVKSLNYRRTGKEKVLKGNPNEAGYLQVFLCKKGKRTPFMVHILVYKAFVGDIPKGLEVNHIDECKTNNCIDNLNLLTHKENINFGTRNYRAGIAISKAKKKAH